MLNQEMLGKKLQRLRELKGVGRETIAEMLHVDSTTYGRYETGKARPPLNHLKSLAEYFEVSMDTLISTEPMIFSIQNAQGTQVGNGIHAKFVQHVVSEEFVREVFQRFDRHMTQQELLNEKLIDMINRISVKGH